MFDRTPWYEREPLSFFPSAPDDALIFSRCIAYHLLARNRSIRASKIILFDNEFARSVDPFGANLGKLMQVLPRSGISVDYLFERATLFGFYSGPLSPERKKQWRHNQLTGDARFINKFVTGSSGQKIRLIKEHLNFCKICRRDDEMAFGVGHWRTMHQLPGVTHCPIHLIPLSGLCAKCNSPTASEDIWHPPGETCPHCGSHVFFEDPMPQLSVHLRFVELCNLAAHGTSVGLASADRKQLYSQFYQRTGRPIDQRVDKLIDVLLKRWNVETLEKLQTLLKVMITRKFLTQAIASQDTIQSPGGHLAVIAALEAEGYPAKKLSPTKPGNEAIHTQALSGECQAILDELECDASRLIKAIERVCDFQGLPTEIGTMLIDGSQVEATRQFRIDQYRGAKLLVALDEIDFKSECIVSPSNLKGPEFNFTFLRKAMNWHKLRNSHRAAIRDLFMREQYRLDDARDDTLRSAIWIGKNDNAWLDALYHADDPVGEKVRMRSRESIINAIKNGCRIPFSVRHSVPIAFELCRLFDASWLDSTMPPTKYKGLSFEDKQVRCRRIIVIAIEAGITNRANMPKRAKRWCLENDREWLDRILPCKWPNGRPLKKP
jgi:DNA-directed RNA polymerase subunit RPC12/RpoP